MHSKPLEMHAVLYLGCWLKMRDLIQIKLVRCESIVLILLVSELEALHNQGGTAFGVDEEGQIADMLKTKRYEATVTKMEVLKLATEMAILILRSELLLCKCNEWF